MQTLSTNPLPATHNHARFSARSRCQQQQHKSLPCNLHPFFLPCTTSTSRDLDFSNCTARTMWYSMYHHTARHNASNTRLHTKMSTSQLATDQSPGAGNRSITQPPASDATPALHPQHQSSNQLALAAGSACTTQHSVRTACALDWHTSQAVADSSTYIPQHHTSLSDTVWHAQHSLHSQ
jgi:hypothetical protein